MKTPIKHIIFDVKELDRFRKAYNEAIESGAETFQYLGVEYFCSTCGLLIAYLEKNLNFMERNKNLFPCGEGE